VICWGFGKLSGGAVRGRGGRAKLWAAVARLS